MSTDVVKSDAHELLERVVVKGDLAGLTSAERLTYYTAVCNSVGLNPLTRPLDYLTLNGKLVLYANRSCTDQLRTLHGVSITKLERDKHADVYVVTAYATDGKGRTDAATGAVFTGQMKGDMLANALMKAETKAKRRVTLSLCGLGLLDETEVETIAGAVKGEAIVVGRGDTDGVSERSAGASVAQAERAAPRVAEPQHAPGDPAAPQTDPESHREESETLLPKPEDDAERTRMIGAIQAIFVKHKPSTKEKMTMKRTYLGSEDANPNTCDVASLADLLKYLEARYPHA